MNHVSKERILTRTTDDCRIFEECDKSFAQNFGRILKVRVEDFVVHVFIYNDFLEQLTLNKLHC